jgi:hypothetical protein
MSYAILITGQTNEVGTLKQYLLASNDGKNFAWSRTTSGGRGVENAWNSDSYSAIVTNADNETSFVVGAILSTPLTPTDVNAINTNEKPIVLIQKLTKQFGLRDKTISNQTMGEVITKVNNLITQNPELLAEYRSDGRSDKSATTSQVAPTIVTPTVTPSIVIEREYVAPTSIELNNYTITIPTKEQVGSYIPRIFTGGVSEREFYKFARTHKKNILLEGPAGSGKTSSPMHEAYQNNQGCVVVSHSIGIELSHLVGKQAISNGEVTYQYGVLVQAMIKGDIYVADEIDFALPKILQRYQDVLQNRLITLVENNGEVIHAHPNFQFVATYNNGYRHSNKMNEALLDRFGLKLRYDYDHEIEKQLIKSETLLQLANQMRAESIQGTYATPISLRLLLNFQSISQLNYDFAVENFVMSFNDDERSSVKLLLEAHRFQLEQELTNKVNA